MINISRITSKFFRSILLTRLIKVKILKLFKTYYKNFTFIVCTMNNKYFFEELLRKNRIPR